MGESQPPQTKKDSEGQHSEQSDSTDNTKAVQPVEPALQVLQPIGAPASQSATGTYRQSENQDRNNWFWKSLQECRITDIVIAFFTAMLFVVAWRQTNLVTDANRTAERAADSAKEAVDSARDSAKKEMRAYVSLVKGRVTGIEGNGPINIRLTIKNSGRTPSHETIVEANIKLGPYPPLIGDQPLKQDVPTALAEGEEAYLDQEIPVDASDRPKLRAGKKMAIYASGSVTYKDVFGEPHTSSFNLIQGGEYEIKAPQMGLRAAGNDSD
ncbi:MAG TPA: hypothetical protein VMJ32_08640 [Pirellulales bacterium]|nr:hypothetical protein [Pirellulales bacterium]